MAALQAIPATLESRAMPDNRTRRVLQIQVSAVGLGTLKSAMPDWMPDTALLNLNPCSL